ncbi:hypothetical protein HDV01_005222 [Terramyces sp. JEL0728]|nr:hypothetical protein HDV01_005222 [Terramyces sp. JEL0728]
MSIVFLLVRLIAADVFIAVNSPDCWPSPSLSSKNADLFANFYYISAPTMAGSTTKPIAPLLKRQNGNGRPPPTGSGLPANGPPPAQSGLPAGQGQGGLPPPVTIGCFPSVTSLGTYSNWQNTTSGVGFYDQCTTVTCDTGCKAVSTSSNKCGSPYQVANPNLSSSFIYNSIGILNLSNNESPSSSNSTLTSQTNPASTENNTSGGSSGMSNVAIVVVAISVVIFLCSALLLVYFYDIRGKRKAREAAELELEEFPLQQSEPSSYVSGMDRGTYLMYLDRVDREK